MADGEGRNKHLNNALYQMGRMVGVGWIERETVERDLKRAADAASMDPAVAEDMIRRRRGPLEKGMREPPPNPRGHKTVELVCAADVVIRPKNWLWTGHLLRGAQELLAGIPGVGKSQVQCSYIASATAGSPWPDGTPGTRIGVIMLTAEDALEDEVVPRLIAAGADLKLVHILKWIKTDNQRRQSLLAEDLDELERVASRLGNVGLITIDPITAYMGGRMDSHKATEVRSQLGPLKDLAERFNVCISTITHPAKNASHKAIDHFIGSQAFVAAARLAHICVEETEEVEDEDGKTKRVPTGRVQYAQAKHNPTLRQPTLVYRIVGTVIGQDPETRQNIAAPHVVWEGEVNVSADEALAVAAGRCDAGKGKDTAQAKAQVFLQNILKDGPVEATRIFEEGQRAGFSEKQHRPLMAVGGAMGHRRGSDGRSWCLYPPNVSRPSFKIGTLPGAAQP
jgi:hypothetical protein